MVDYSLIKNIVFGIRKYVEKQEILHLSFIRAYSDLVKLSNIEFLPRSGFVFDEEMNKWEFIKHGCGYAFSHEGTIIDINDYFLSNGDFFSANRLFFYFESIRFNFKNQDADDAIKSALIYLESTGGIVKVLPSGYYKFLSS
ncbi:DUF6896 domain-containing protein [Delftia acidovorans]